MTTDVGRYAASDSPRPDWIGTAVRIRSERPSGFIGISRQRVALGRALIREPQLFLLDEPLSNLDAALRVQMRAELIRLHTRLDETTTVYVTHDQVEALTMGDRVAVLKDGALMQVDTPVELYEHPCNAFVAEFIGSPKMNLLAGQLVPAPGGPVLECLGERVQLPDGIQHRLTEISASAVLVGIRPHDLQRAGDYPGSVRLRAEVDVCEHTGTEIFVTVLRDGVKLAARFPRWPVPHHGETVEVSFDPDQLYLFDAASGQSLLGRARSGGRAQVCTESAGDPPFQAASSLTS